MNAAFFETFPWCFKGLSHSVRYESITILILRDIFTPLLLQHITVWDNEQEKKEEHIPYFFSEGG